MTANVGLKKNRTKMFSVTAADCRWDVFRGSGDGGQKKQKTSSGVRCVHPPSGAEGKATDNRHQNVNRKTAFERMAATPEFQSWLKLKIEAGLGHVEIEEVSEQGNKFSRKLGMEEV
jgi:protein subunit release factor A